MGLFLIVINAFIILLASKLVTGFAVQGFGTTLIFGVVLWIVNSALEGLNKALEKINFSKLLFYHQKNASQKNNFSKPTFSDYICGSQTKTYVVDRRKL
ncbi:MAG: phage holin family protein [Bacteroidia bacterium]